MVWSVFKYLLTQKLPRKAKVALGCPQYQKLLKTLKVAQKLQAQSIYAYPQLARLFQAGQCGQNMK